MLSPSTLITVDSNPMSVEPPSNIYATFPSSSSIISSTLVPLGFPETFALGAAIGTPDFSINSFAIKLLGILIPTVSRFAVTTSGIISLLLRLNIIVSGPGQKFSISFFSNSVISSTISSTILIFET